MTTATVNFAKKVREQIESTVLPRMGANWKIILFFALSVGALLMFYYAFLVLNLTKGLYLANNYERRISELALENRKLQLVFAENSFLGNVSEKAEALDFQKTTSIKYIQVLDNSLAAAK